MFGCKVRVRHFEWLYLLKSRLYLVLICVLCPDLGHILIVLRFSDICLHITGGWWHLNWGGWAHGIKETMCHSIPSVQDIIMSRPPLSSLQCYTCY